jgi:hypothetical protein
MPAVRSESQVLRAIVVFGAVDVVKLLRLVEFPPEALSHHELMLCNHGIAVARAIGSHRDY